MSLAGCSLWSGTREKGLQEGSCPLLLWSVLSPEMPEHHPEATLLLSAFSDCCAGREQKETP